VLRGEGDEAEKDRRGRDVWKVEGKKNWQRKERQYVAGIL
jgi:hypothetical protein